MKTTRTTISLLEQQDAWVKARIKTGEFSALKRAIHEGLASGISSRRVTEIWEEAEAVMRRKSN
jgi:hypothetical protein